jgi:hypothetical protein
VRLHLISHNSTWLQNLARDIPEANWHLTSIVNDPIRNARHAGTVPGFKKFEKLFEKLHYKLPNAPTDLLWMWPPCLSHSPNRVSRSRLLTGIPGPIQMVASCQIQEGKQDVSTTPVRATLAWLNLMVLV